MANCNKCQARIVWITMKSNQRMPCDALQTDVNGEALLVFPDGTTGKTHDKFKRGHISHFATCPNATDFRKVMRRISGRQNEKSFRG